MRESKHITTSKTDDSPNHTGYLESSSLASHCLYQASVGEIPCVFHPEGGGSVKCVDLSRHSEQMKLTLTQENKMSRKDDSTYWGKEENV